MERFNLASWFVDRHLEEGRGGRVALHCGERAVTYAELAGLVNRAGHVLRDLGVRQEERVLLALGDGVEFVATWYAAQKIGAVTAEVYTFLPAKDLPYYLEYTRAGVVVADGTTLERVREARGTSPWLRTVLVVGVPDEQLGDGEASFDTLVARAPDALDPAPTTPDDIAIWKFTTGSTGTPKACVHRMETPLRSFEHYARGVLGMHEDDVVLPVPKLFFGYARDLAALYPFGVGAAGVVFPERSTAERIFELVARHRPSILVNVPTMMRAMLEVTSAGHPDPRSDEEPRRPASSNRERDLSCLRLCTSAGEALPEELHRRWLDTFGVEVLDGIGSSEAYHIYISNRPGAARPGTLGQAVPGYGARVVDEEGRELADGETGRLWVQGDTTALMYWNARETSLETYAGDVVMSGDLFARDADGYFRYRGRADDLLKVGGIWVAPQEIERCLAGHPDVAECAVVGYEEDGLQKPRAFVVLRVGAPADAAALQSHVKATLSPHKYPRDVRFLDELPRTGAGKIDRRALREVVA
ncbi:MAG TPA: benzoate-CoA ligase family protein [Solirubrobacteraceae bacterium]|nr:benzoate-CoA ligase family protein [Solirubrobacteraceae bacterium]